MASCGSCGSLVEEDATSCWHCGVSLELLSRAPAPELLSQAPAPELLSQAHAPELLSRAPELAAGAGSIRAESSTRRAVVGPTSVTRSLSESVSAELPTLSARLRDEVYPAQPRAAGEGIIGREIIGQYVIRSKLGEGGMGEVYLADQPAIGRQVAIKVVHPAMVRTADRREGVERFRNEARAAASLESPHIVKIFNWGELDDGTLFMAMEYLPGHTLSELLRKHRVLDPALAVHVATQVCAALVDAHAAGIVHRDLKPSNIMLIERSGDPHFAKVLDFGVAKLEGSDITRSGALFGTPQYMSPEQLQATNVDGRSDLYALGVILYEMLTGSLPFTAPTAIGFITQHLHKDPPALPKPIPRALARVVMNLLAKDPAERPRNASTVARQLEEALRGRAPRATRHQQRRALRSATTILGASLALATLSLGGWWIWWQQVETERQLQAERERSEGLERELVESERALRAREEARAAAKNARQAGQQAKHQLVVRGPTPIKSAGVKLNPETRRLYGLSRAELERELERLFASIKLQPSEVEERWIDYRKLEAQLPEAERDDALREHLVTTIGVYRNFERLRPGDLLSLAKLEQVFRSMDTLEPLTSEQREEILAASRTELEKDASLSAVDRAFLQRLALADLIRKYAADSRIIDQPREPISKPAPAPQGPSGLPEPPPVPDKPFEADPRGSSPLPSPVDDPTNASATSAAESASAGESDKPDPPDIEDSLPSVEG